MPKVTIYHNPACGTSRNTLALLREKGLEVEVVEYLKVGWTAAGLEALIRATGGTARDLLRTMGTPAEALGLTDPARSEAELIAAMVKDPILVNRPIVVSAKGAALCRPADRALALI